MIKEDGQMLLITGDFNRHRINVEVKDGYIVEPLTVG